MILHLLRNFHNFWQDKTFICIYLFFVNISITKTWNLYLEYYMYTAVFVLKHKRILSKT